MSTMGLILAVIGGIVLGSALILFLFAIMLTLFFAGLRANAPEVLDLFFAKKREFIEDVALAGRSLVDTEVKH
jgi:hypothetical protein